MLRVKERKNHVLVSFIENMTKIPEANSIHAIIRAAINILNKSEVCLIPIAPLTNLIDL